MSTKIDSKYKQKGGIVFEEVDGQVHILDEHQDAIITLNSTATFIWKCLSRPKTLRELVINIVSEYAIEEKIAYDDTKEILKQLNKLALISVT
jgi:hypothetical protein